MADYGYSASYRGMTGGVLPPGYLEAATAPGRNYGSALANIGQNVAGAIRGYIKNKEEEQYLTSKIEAGLAQYANVGKQGPLPSGQEANLQHLGGIVGEKNLEKFMSGKASRMEKLAIANSLETYADKEYKTLQSNILSEQLKKLESERQQQAGYTKATQEAANVPIYETGFVPQTATRVTPDYQALQQMYAEALAPRVAPTTPTTAQWFQPQQAQPQIPQESFPAAGKVILPGDGTQIVPTPTTAKYFQGIQPSIIKAEPKLGPAPAPEVVQPEISPNAGRVPLPIQVPTKETTVPAAPEVYQRAKTYEELVPEFTKILKANNLPVTRDAIEQMALARGVEVPIQAQSQVLPSGATIVSARGKTEISFPQKAQVGQPLAVEEVKKLNSIKSVSKSLEDIKSSLEKTLTGPVIGSLRKLNTFDKTRKEIESLIQGALPEVARGLYGEVGVLTDKDVERYQQMLPSIRDSKDLANALISNLEKKLKSSYEDSIDIYSKSGKNISGFPASFSDFIRSKGSESQPEQGGMKSMTYNPATGKIQ